MNRSQDVFTNHTLVEHDGILIVVTLPRHVGNEQVAAQGEFAVFSGITFRQDVALLHTLTLLANRTKVDGHVLVGATELRNLVSLGSRVEADKLFFLATVVCNHDAGGINEVDHAFAFCRNHRARIFTNLLFDTGTHDRSLGTNQRNSLAHHVRSHQCAVGVVVFQERNQRSSDRGNLLRSHVHEFHL